MNLLTKLGLRIMSVPVIAFIIMVLLETPMDVVKGTVMVMTYFFGLGLSIQRNNAPRNNTYDDYVEPKPVKVIYIEPMVSNPRPVSFDPDETIHFKSRRTANTSYYYLWDYYPKKKYPELEDELQWQRIEVWDFKDGLNPMSMDYKISSA